MRGWKSERIVGLHEPQVNEDHLAACGMPDDRRLRLLSFNIQVGNSTQGYRHYLTRSWQHVLPHKGRAGNLERIGDLLGDFDLVALVRDRLPADCLCVLRSMFAGHVSEVVRLSLTNDRGPSHRTARYHLVEIRAGGEAGKEGGLGVGGPV